MKKSLLLVLFVVVILASVLGPGSPSAHAIKPFMDEFYQLYLKPDSKDSKDMAYVALVQKAKCDLCHQGTSKKERNAYGKAIDVLLDRKTDKDNKEKIRKALAAVAAIRCDPAKPASPTFGQVISQGRLPGGDPKPPTRDSTVSVDK